MVLINELTIHHPNCKILLLSGYKYEDLAHIGFLSAVINKTLITQYINQRECDDLLILFWTYT